MEYLKSKGPGYRTNIALFPFGRHEAHAIIHADSDVEFANQLTSVENACKELQIKLGMTPVFKRYFLTDIVNQYGEITETRCAVSLIEQPPLDKSKIALWVVFQQESDYVETSEGVWADSRGRLIFGDKRQRCLDNRPFDSREETMHVLNKLSDELRRRGGSMLDNCVRTWFMVRDVDKNYKGVVEGRNEIFAREGLTCDSHFISSTGIGGRPVEGTVAFNAVCDTRLVPGQMNFLYGSTHLNPTIEYGVAFERGTSIDYHDRRHVYISGTASIDNRGEIVHPGNIRAQAMRMIENIRVLIREAGCDDNDLAHLIVYLRDIADFRVVDDIFEDIFPEIPRVIVHAPVCRPGWLIETECMAIRKASYPEYAAF